MSVEILYGRQFIDLKNGKIIPLVLSGSSNCTEYVRGREVLERNWWALRCETQIAPNDLVRFFKDIVSDGLPHEFFAKGYRGGPWLNEKNIVKWVENGIEAALSIEEILKYRPSQSLTCEIQLFGDKHYEHTKLRFCKTTEDILEWIEEYDSYPVKEGFSKCALIRFSGREPLALDRVKRCLSGPVICKLENGYLIENRATGFSSTRAKENATIFKSQKDFEDICLVEGKYMPMYKLVPASLNPKKQGCYVVRVSSGLNSGLYYNRGTKSGCRLCCHSRQAKHFLTEKAADKFAAICNAKYPRSTFVSEKEEEQ